MADGILGLGTSGSVDLNDELLTKLKTAESTSKLDPITADIEETEAVIVAVDEIEVVMMELLELVESFDLFTTNTNAFNEVYATTSGSSVSFDATDTTNLKEGSINVSVTQLAQKDVYQSNLITNVDEKIGSGELSITVGEDTYTFSTDSYTYAQLADELNTYSKLDVALEQVSDGSYRMIIKSSESGLSNEMTITQTDIDLGFEEEENHVLNAQNLLATVDGISYDISTNTITMKSGLVISALETGDSSISLQKDTSSIISNIENIADKYNELVDLMNTYTLGDSDTTAIITDSSTLKTIMNAVKDIFFDSYGLEEEENIFKYGITFDSSGYMQIDSSELSTAISENFDDLKELFVGYAEKEGIGTRLKTYLDSLDDLDGLLTTYKEKLDNDLDTLNDDYESESEKLDEKYEQMAQQFADYTVIITAMENSFASLKAIIESDSD
ncbi:MAG: flagellar filament capping protein FliD [Arcobacteraceae bacterium]